MVESSSFVSEFVVLIIATDMVEALRYKLRMFGVPLDEPADMCYDNQSIVKNASTLKNVLHKWHNEICYHRVREAHSTSTIRVGWIMERYNTSDICTKTTISSKYRHEVMDSIFCDKWCVVIQYRMHIRRRFSCYKSKYLLYD